MTQPTFLFLALCCAAWFDGSADDRALLRKAARQSAAAAAKPAESPAPAPAGEDRLSESEREARRQLALAEARVELIEARKALAQGRGPDAEAHARRVLGLLSRLPDSAEAEADALQADGVLARAARLTTGTGEITAAQSSQPDAAAEREMQDAAPPDPTQTKARQAARLARRYDGADTDDVDTTGDANRLRERAHANQAPHRRYGYRPAEEIIDREAVLHRDQQRWFYERALRDAYLESEAERLLAADEARVAPDGEIAYPDDWPQKTARRARYRDGVVARSPSWVDKDGREWYVAIYDISDLTYVPPNFIPTEGVPLGRNLRDALDRDALRYRSQIFSGYADDLAAGIPLLRYFGGTDDLMARGGGYSLERQREIVDLIQRFTGARSAEPSAAP